MSKKLSYQYIKEQLLKEEYQLKDDYYLNNKTIMETICPKGHIYKVSWSNWKKGRRCKCERSFIRYNFEDIVIAFKNSNYKLISESYEAGTKLQSLCPNGHLYEVLWGDWKNGSRCPLCRYDIVTIDYIREAFKKENYTLLSTSFTSYQDKLKFKCPNGHIHFISWSIWKIGVRCGKCYKPSINNKDIKNIFNKEDYTIKNEKDIENAFSYISFECPINHKHKIRWNNWQQGQRCGICSNNKSKAELNIRNLIESHNIKTESHKQLIAPYELDIIIPEKKIAIEYCGLYWHSELQGKDKNYHLNKLQLCNEKGYRLITIFSDEWLNNKISVENKLLYYINYIKTKIKLHARKCKITNIKQDVNSVFLQEYHLQGKGSSSIKLGAFHNEELVAVMTFSRPSIAKGARNQDFLEINRFCTHKDYHIPGIASKLLTYFERNYEWSKIVSYADRRWSEGNLYYKLGFNLVGETKPNYWYLDKNYTKRIHRFALRKKPDEPKNKTEWQLRQEQGYDRIWDCGSLKFEKSN